LSANSCPACRQKTRASGWSLRTIKLSCVRPCANSVLRLATPTGARWMWNADTRCVRSALTEAGYLAALIPEEYDGRAWNGGSLHHSRRSDRCGGNAACLPCADVHHGHRFAPRQPEQNDGFFRRLQVANCASGLWSDRTQRRQRHTKITTAAVRKGDRYVVNGQKVWTSRVQHTDLMLLLARTSPASSDPKEKTLGLSTLLVDLRDASRARWTCGRSAR